MTLFRQALLVAGKDLRIEARSRVAVNQVLPFAGIVLLLFAFALDPNRGLLPRVAPGLFWVAVLLSGLLAISRAFAVEGENGVRDALRLSGLDGAAVFCGKALAVAAQLLVLEVILGIGVVVLYDLELHNPLVVLAASLDRDRRARRRRYRVRSARGGSAGPGDAVSPARPACRGAGHARCDPGLGGGARRRPVRGVALDSAPGRVRGDLRDDRLAGLRAAVGGDMSGSGVPA